MENNVATLTQQTTNVFAEKGTWIKITKVASFAGSEVEVGETIIGVLEFNLKEGNTVKLTENNPTDYLQTSPIKKLQKTQGGDTIITTTTSTYFLQELK